jgi:hypothetical protein
MKTLLRLAFAGLLALAPVAASAAILVLIQDGGGIITDYVRKYSDMRDSGVKLVVAGECASACTLFLGIMPPSQYCVTEAARLGFHTATEQRKMPDGKIKVSHAGEMSYLMFSLYPVQVRKLVKKLGWDGDKPEIEHRELVYIEGEDLQKVAPICKRDGT